MLLQDLVLKTASRTPDQTALIERDDRISYAQLAAQVREFADFLLESGLQPGERVGVYLNKQIASVVSFFGTALAGCVIVPINSRLKTVQVAHILNDCGVRVLVSSSALVDGLGTTWHAGPELAAVISIDGPPANPASQLNWFDWGSLPAATASEVQPHIVDADIAAIFYTSGSTGLPKGVVLSHRNIVAGAHSVAEYLENGAEDIVLAVLPLSFDAGFSQLTT
ncbi:MAG: AMP-binding protein, partial [Pseudomonadota bacterium]